ncbi:MAG: hypothetical protein ABR981_00685 [Candidatus Micrarchaeaceae archaeon]
MQKSLRIVYEKDFTDRLKQASRVLSLAKNCFSKDRLDSATNPDKIEQPVVEAVDVFIEGLKNKNYAIRRQTIEEVKRKMNSPKNIFVNFHLRGILISTATCAAFDEQKEGLLSVKEICKAIIIKLNQDTESFRVISIRTENTLKILRKQNINPIEPRK